MTRKKSHLALRYLRSCFTLTLLGLILGGCFRTPSPELASQAIPNITITNLDGVPFNDRLVFHRINTLVTTHLVHNRSTLRLANNGTQAVTIDSLVFSTSLFRLPNGETTFVLPAGGTRNLVVEFSDTVGPAGVKQATLTLKSGSATQVVQLAGIFQSRPEGSNEPTLQQIVNTYGYKTNVGLPLTGTDVALKGDEVRSNFWKRANTATPMYVRQLAAFHGCCTSAVVINFLKKTDGLSLGSVQHDARYSQTLLPLRANSTNATELFLQPTVPFEVRIDGYSSNVSVPRNNGQLTVRFFQAKDRAGVAIANSYIVTQDYVPAAGCNGGTGICDYNDNVYLITNVAPENQIQTSYRLDVGGSAAYTDVNGNTWSPDTGFFSPNTAPSEPQAGASTNPIGNTLDDKLYQTYRALIPGNPAVIDRKLTFNLPVPSGSYDIRLHFSELFWDAPGKRVFDVSLEGTIVLDNFDILTETSKFSALRKVFKNVQVSDGSLTLLLQAVADYGSVAAIEVAPAGALTPESPHITGSFPNASATNVFRDTAVIADVALPNPGAGVDIATLTATNVKLFQTSTSTAVPGNINTTGGADAIVFQPTVLLNSSTNYTFQITAGVKDESGAAFTPFTTTFTTGTSRSVVPDPNVSFTKTSQYTGSAVASLTIGPDSKLYGSGLDGVMHRWQINGDGSLSNEETFVGLQGSAVIGLVFDPTNPNVLWLTANNALFPEPAADFSGKIYRLTLNGPSFSQSQLQLYIIGLPRSAKDHLSNSLAFGPDGLLYLNQGSNSAMGAPDNAWFNRPERLLSGSILQINPTLTSGLPINVQTEACDVHCQGSGTSGSYSPNAAGAPVKIYASGIRNAYDLVWHTNGSLYIPANGSAAGGNTPDNPGTAADEGLANVATQDDYLFRVVQGGYYGHPNPKNSKYILNGGNPTSGVDPAEVVAEGTYAGYAVGVQPESTWQGFAFNFGRNRSPDGAIQYKSDSFNSSLQNKLLVVEYSGGDDILALPLAANGTVNTAGVTQIVANLKDPLDLVEDTRNGNLYVASLVNGGESGLISLFRPTVAPSNSAPIVNAGPDQQLAFPASVTLDGTVTDDGKPTGSTLTTTWSKQSGPGTVTFGNAAAQDTTASFSVAGTYVLQLSASDSVLSSNDTVTIVLTSGTTNTPPTANFTFSCTTLTCTFTDTSTDTDGSVVGWQWSFGDSTTATTQNSSRTYSAAGTYTVTLTVTDNNGATNSVSKAVAANVAQAVTSFSLINADSNTVVSTLSNGGTINYATLGTSNITVRANTSPAAVGSVSFTLDGALYRIESLRPYVLSGDSNNSPLDYFPVSPALAAGTHTLTATPYTQSLAGGTAGTALTISFTVSSVASTPGLTWSSTTAQAFNNSEAQGLAVNGKLYSFGGFDSQKSCCTPTKRAYVFDPVTPAWSPIADMPAMGSGTLPGGLTHAGVTTDGTNIYFAGGYTANAAGTGQIFGTKEVWRYSTASNTYSKLVDLPIARAAGQLEYSGGKLHYFGGTNLARTQDVGDHYVLNLNNQAAGWATAAPLPNPRHHLGSAALGTKIYAIGGQHGHDAALVPQSDVHVYDTITNTWTQVANLTASRNHISEATFVLNGNILVLGGQMNHNNALSTVSSYNPQTNLWANLTPLPAPRSSGVGDAISGALYYASGSTTKTTYKGTF
jgi:N-acetylneuraminic acid mutarotase